MVIESYDRSTTKAKFQAQTSRMGRVSLDATGFRHLLDAMGVLKHMGNMHEDTQRLWCADWAR